jgi:hypothetical protein
MPTAYFGLDYIAAATAIWGMYLLGSRKASGFVLYAVSSTAMLGLAILIDSPPIFIANAIALAVTLRGLRKWSREQSGAVPPSGRPPS